MNKSSTNDQSFSSRSHARSTSIAGNLPPDVPRDNFPGYLARDVKRPVISVDQLRFQRFFSMILPIIRPTLLVIVLITSIRSINSVGLIYSITAGAPAVASTPAPAAPASSSSDKK